MSNFLDPAILFFLIGIFAGLVRSNLEIPPQIARFLALYLLMALGLKGGFALAKTGFTLEVMEGLLAALFLATLIPWMGYHLLKRRVSPFDAAAIAATYGSVSAVTFITTVQYLDTHGIAYSGHMAAAMALMESPAIILAVLFANAARRELATSPPSTSHSITHVLHESFTDGAQLLLLGAMWVGYVSGETGKAMMAPFSIDLFKGMLAFFLLDMGLLTAKNIGHLKGTSPFLMAYGVLGPMLHAAMAFVLASLLGLSQGDAALLMVLAASASYIAVPAVVRYAIPEAKASLYFGLSLGVTFPLNIIFGIPIYVDLANHVWRLGA
jgi:uncharacterized protein